MSSGWSTKYWRSVSQAGKSGSKRNLRLRESQKGIYKYSVLIRTNIYTNLNINLQESPWVLNIVCIFSYPRWLWILWDHWVVFSSSQSLVAVHTGSEGCFQQWNCAGIIMKITMKSPRHYYENHNEISQALLRKSQWNRPGNIMKIIMKYPRHYYENRNEISQALLWKL